jgi:hypothetical protein
MKRLLFIATSVVAACSVQAQKVDLDRFNFTFEYRNLPSTPLDSTYKTFSVSVDASENVENSMGAGAISSRVNLQGFSRVDRKGDVVIAVQIEDLMIDKDQIIENVSENKNKDGSVTKTYSYYVSVDYSMRGTADFRDKNGAELKKGISLFTSRSYNWASSTYKTRSEASSYFYNNKRAIINNLVRERIGEAINELNAHVNRFYGYPITNVSMHLWLNDSKKHPEYEPMNTRWLALKPALQGVTANQISEDTRSKILEMIKYFDGIKTTYNKDEKSDKKLRYAAYYNNSVLYMLLDMPEKAGEEGNGLIANDYDAKDGKYLNESAEALIALFAANHANTRHFSK